MIQLTELTGSEQKVAYSVKNKSCSQITKDQIELEASEKMTVIYTTSTFEVAGKTVAVLGDLTKVVPLSARGRRP